MPTRTRNGARRRARAAADLPPGPPLSRPLTTAIWFRRPQWLLERCHARYGDAFSLEIAHEGTWVLLSDPEAIKQVFTADPASLHAGEANVILLPVLGSRSVLLLDEGSHMEQRKLLLPPFHGRRMQRYEELMRDVVAQEVERWPADGTPVRMWPRMQAVTLEVILRAVFGLEEGERLDRFRTELRRLLAMVLSPAAVALVMTLGPRRVRDLAAFRRALEPVDRLLYDEIASRRRAADVAEREDILSLLLGASHEDGSPMSDRELRDELMTLLVAGHETTATALSWALERLVRHPHMLRRLEREAEAGGEEYADAVVAETLRLRPVLSLVIRRLTEPMEIGGHELPAGVSVAPCIYLVHRRPDIYPEPERFRPERFLEQPPGTYTWIPFGGGVRRCLGASFAQFEMRIVLQELVRRRALLPGAAGDERSRRRGITNVPGRGAEVIATGRGQPAPPERAAAAAVAEP